MTLSLTHWWATIIATMSPLEIVAALVSVASVVLTARQHISNFPVGIVACVLYMWVFKGARLYADVGLQLFFIGVGAWDWRQWTRGGHGGDELRVAFTPARTWFGLLLVFVVGTFAQGWLLSSHTDAVAPFTDSAIFWASVGAQWMIGRKYIENWIVWIVVDVGATVLYWSKGLPITSALYALFCGLAVWGWVEWNRSRRAPAPLEPRADYPPIALP